MTLSDVLAKKREPKPQPVRAVPRGPITGTREEKYAARALHSECDRVASAAEGTRNDSLNVAAYSLGQLVGGGLLNETEARSALANAAASAGLGANETSATITSGLEKGKLEPRGMPVNDTEHTTQAHAAPVARASDGSQVELMDAAAIWAPLETPRYVVAPIIRAGSLVEIVAYGASGKSWIGADLVVSVAAGLPWLGRFETDKRPALYLDHESGAYEMRRRFQAITAAREIESPVADVSLAAMPPLYMTAPDYESKIERLATGRGLVVIDTLKAANPGIDENDSNMRTGLDALHRVGERTDAAFVVLVHAKKTTGTVATIDPREAGRGSSAIFDAADTVLHMHYQKGEPLTVRQTKSRLGRDLDPFAVRIVDTENGGVLVQAEDLPEPTSEDSVRAWDELCDRIVAFLRDCPGSSGRVVKAKVTGKGTNISAALEYLESNGVIRNAGTQSNAKWFPREVASN